MSKATPHAYYFTVYINGSKIYFSFFAIESTAPAWQLARFIRSLKRVGPVGAECYWIRFISAARSSISS